jgi:hypothetical protein
MSIDTYFLNTICPEVSSEGCQGGFMQSGFSESCLSPRIGSPHYHSYVMDSSAPFAEEEESKHTVKHWARVHFPLMSIQSHGHLWLQGGQRSWVYNKGSRGLLKCYCCGAWCNLICLSLLSISCIEALSDSGLIHLIKLWLSGLKLYLMSLFLWCWCISHWYSVPRSINSWIQDYLYVLFSFNL